MRLSHYIASGRARLAATVVGNGNGAPVVFLHAGVADGRMWCEQLGALSRAGHRAIAYDRRGMGQTEWVEEDYSAVADLVAVLRAVATDQPAILVGCSQGGQIAVDAALLHPGWVRALVLIAPSVSGAPPANHPRAIQDLLGRLDAAQRAGDGERVNAIKAHCWLDGPLEPEGRVTGEPRERFLAMNGIILRAPAVGANLDVTPAYPRLRDIAAPALVLSGALDFPHIQARCRHVATAMPRATLQELPGVAHLPSLERPHDVTERLVAFCQDCR